MKSREMSAQDHCAEQEGNALKVMQSYNGRHYKTRKASKGHRSMFRYKRESTDMIEKTKKQLALEKECRRFNTAQQVHLRRLITA